jgi:hypothetical protein
MQLLQGVGWSAGAVAAGEETHLRGSWCLVLEDVHSTIGAEMGQRFGLRFQSL